jgi:hypothetical protein
MIVRLLKLGLALVVVTSFIGVLASSTGAADAASFSSAGSLNTAAEQAALNGPPSLAVTAGDPLGTFEATLESDFPNSFAGLFQTPAGDYDVVVVGSAPHLESTAEALYAQIPAQFGNSSVSPPALVFSSGLRTLAQLYAIRSAVISEASPTISNATASTLQGIYAAGIDVADNQVRVESTVPADSPLTASGEPASDLGVAESEFGVALNIVVGTVPTSDNRIADSSPFKGGDELLANNGNGTWTVCTLGFGVVFTDSGSTGGLSAGHCGDNDWYNGNYNAPNENIFVGSTIALSTQTADTQMIGFGGSFSDQIWAGPIGSPHLDTIDGWADPIEGADVDAEGSIAGERPGVVVATDVDWTSCPPQGGTCEQLEDGVEETNTLDAGDSGGPLLYPSDFGYLAGGDLVSSSSTTNYSEEIDPLLFIWSLEFSQSVQVLTPDN